MSPTRHPPARPEDLSRHGADAGPPVKPGNDEGGSNLTENRSSRLSGSVQAVAIVGAGFGGIGMALRLKRAGITDFVLLERASEVGGTWRDNTYPGCACDIPSHLYSFSFVPQADWSRDYPEQAEIREYLRDCVERHGLRPHLRVNADAREAVFDLASGQWRVTLADGTSLYAQVLILARGGLSEPLVPAIEGLSTFAGPVFHSARWDHGLDLTGRRVGVIGTGASAIQFVPRIAERAGRVVLFQRTPAWILPKHDRPLSPAKRWALRRVPLLRRAYRAFLYWSHEARAVPFVLWPGLMRLAERQARGFAKRQLGDSPLRERVTPDYRMGCKRVLLSNDFLPALALPRVELVSEAITRVTPTGIVTADGVERALDVLILATGFQATDPFGTIRVVGADGTEARDGPRAFLGMALPHCPNLFLLGGPNTGLGHNSIVFMLEAQIGHILRRLQRLRRSGARTLEIDPAAAARFNVRLDRLMARTVWLSGCRSWYLDAAGRNTTLWPGFSFGFWLRNRLGLARDWRLRR